MKRNISIHSMGNPAQFCTTSFTLAIGGIMATMQRCSHPNVWNTQICCFNLIQLSLDRRWASITWLGPGKSRMLVKERWKQENVKVTWQEKIQLSIPGFAFRMWHEPQRQAACRGWKKQERRHCPKASKKKQFCQHFGFGPVRPALVFCPLDYKMMNLVLL